MTNKDPNVWEELKTISPRVAGMKKPNRPKTDDAFFDSMQASVFEKIGEADLPTYQTKPAARAPWLRMAAAFMLILAAAFLLSKGDSPNDDKAETRVTFEGVRDETIVSYLKNNLDLMEAELLIADEVKRASSDISFSISDEAFEEYLQDASTDELESYF